MKKCLDKLTQVRPEKASPALPTMAHGLSSAMGSPASGPAPQGKHFGLRFPPTRAARAPRSRGVFLEKPDEILGAGWPRWIEVLGTLAALAVAALALTVSVNTASVFAGPAFGTNPGPAIVAAASVAPPFVQPAQPR
jgi:hypothetical protein